MNERRHCANSAHTRAWQLCVGYLRYGILNSYSCCNSHDLFFSLKKIFPVEQVPWFINRAKFARANYIFLKLISILDTTENSGVHTYISGQADQRNMMLQTLVSSLSVPGIDTTEVWMWVSIYLFSNYWSREEIEGVEGRGCKYKLYTSYSCTSK